MPEVREQNSILHVFKLLFYNSRARFTAFSTKWAVFFRDISDKTVVVVT